MVTLFGSLFLEGKKRLFLFICRFIAVKTVFIALMRDFVAMKTVVITDYHGPHGNDDRLHGEKLRTSRKKGGKILWRKQEVFRFVREYSILRKLRFTTLLHLLHLDWQNRNGIWMRCPLHDACCYLVNAWVGQNVRTIWAGISGEIEKWREEGLLFIFSCYKLFWLTETIILISLL